MPEYVYALYNFHPEDRDELALRVGDRIEVIQNDTSNKENWWKGKNAEGRVGLFPKNRVTTQKLSAPEYVYAIYDFNQAEEDEIPFQAGDSIEVVQKPHDDWWLGKKLDGRLGLFPQNRVVPVPTNPEYVYALYDFDPQDELEICLRAGERIEVVQMDNLWWYGRRSDGSLGQFPRSHVVPVSTSPEYVYAVYGFDPQGEDEIRLHPGDCIEVLQKYDGWWHGRKLDGALGLFPQGYTASTPQSPEYVYALYDFDLQEEGDIPLHAGDRIEVVQKVHDDWWLGKKLDGSVGLFPQNRVVPVPTNPEYVYAIYDFDPQDDDEIRLCAGDRIEAVQKHDGWWHGIKLDGMLGLFPQGYTVPAPQNPEYVYATIDFRSEHKGSIPLSAGEKLEVITKGDEYKDDWWQGKNVSGKFGLFPRYCTSSTPRSLLQSEPACVPAQRVPEKLVSKL